MFSEFTFYVFFFFFFFNDTATTEIYTLSLHDALPIFITLNVNGVRSAAKKGLFRWLAAQRADVVCLQEMKCHERSEEHTSELQSPCNLVCRLLLEKKKKQTSVTLTIDP